MKCAGHKKLHAEVTALEKAMYELRKQLWRMEYNWRSDSHNLPERLAGQSIGRINALFLQAYREALALDDCFDD